MFKWYNRKRKYYYGYYDKENRLYYNEDSNKWVSRLNNKVIIEKYIRYEFSCYDDKKIVLDFGWSNIDRVGLYLFLNQLINLRCLFIETKNINETPAAHKY